MPEDGDGDGDNAELDLVLDILGGVSGFTPALARRWSNT